MRDAVERGRETRRAAFVTAARAYTRTYHALATAPAISPRASNLAHAVLRHDLLREAGEDEEAHLNAARGVALLAPVVNRPPAGEELGRPARIPREVATHE